MALNDGGLDDAGRDYYARQFDNRIGSIRKAGAAAPARGSRGTSLQKLDPSPAAPARGSRSYAGRGVIGGGIVALFILGRLVIGCAGAGSSSYNSTSYNKPNYNYTPPPPVVPPPPPQVVFPNDPNGPVWPRDFNQPGDDPANPPFVVPDNPGVEKPNDAPAQPNPRGLDDDRGVPDKDR